MKKSMPGVAFLSMLLLTLGRQDSLVRNVPRVVYSDLRSRSNICAGAPQTGGSNRPNDSGQPLSELFGHVAGVEIHQFGTGFAGFASVATYVHGLFAERPRTVYGYQAWAEAAPMGESGVVGTVRFSSGDTGRFEASGLHVCIEGPSKAYWWVRLAPIDLWPPR